MVPQHLLFPPVSLRLPMDPLVYETFLTALLPLLHPPQFHPLCPLIGLLPPIHLFLDLLLLRLALLLLGYALFLARRLKYRFPLK
jgi:hypothetical protein